MRAWMAIGAALLLFACGPKTPAPEGADEPGASAAPGSVEGPARYYDAVSKTAIAFTDNLEIHDVSPVGPNATPSLKILADLGHVYETSQIASARGGDKIGITTWASLMPIPEDADIAVESVTQELVNAKAPNGGFCAPEKTGFLALATYKEDDGSTMMLIAAFSDASWPPQKTPALCGTFTYQARGGASLSGAAPH